MPLKAIFQLGALREVRRFYSRFVRGGVFLKTEECPVGDIELYKKGANAMQVGGRHYKQLPIEPWDYIAANALGFFEGNIVKYITRAARTKNRDDLLKAQHYLAKLLEITPVEAEAPPKREPVVVGDPSEEQITVEHRSFRSAASTREPAGTNMAEDESKRIGTSATAAG